MEQHRKAWVILSLLGRNAYSDHLARLRSDPPPSPWTRRLSPSRTVSGELSRRSPLLDRVRPWTSTLSVRVDGAELLALVALVAPETTREVVPPMSRGHRTRFVRVGLQSPPATGSHSALAASSPPLPARPKERGAIAQYRGFGPLRGARGVARLDDGDHSGLLAFGRADCRPFAGPPNVLPAFPFPSSRRRLGSPRPVRAVAPISAPSDLGRPLRGTPLCFPGLPEGSLRESAGRLR
jgi:hypothetical protein